MRFDQLSDFSASLKDLKGTLRFRVSEVGASPVDAFNVVADAARAFVPQTLQLSGGIVFLQDIEIHEKVCGIEYLITCPYAPSGVLGRQPGAFQVTIDGSGGTVAIKAGRRIDGFGPAGNKVNNGGLIGVEGDEVKGCDITVPNVKITVMFRHPQGILNDNYCNKICDLVGYPNKDRFLKREPGTMILRSPVFQQTETEATATYGFEYSPKKTNFPIGDINVDLKDGWDVLSVSYKDDVYDNGTNKVKIRKPAYVEIVRPREWVNYVSAFGWGG